MVRAYKEAVKVAGEVEEVTRACMEWMEEKKQMGARWNPKCEETDKYEVIMTICGCDVCCECNFTRLKRKTIAHPTFHQTQFCPNSGIPRFSPKMGRRSERR